MNIKNMKWYNGYNQSVWLPIVLKQLFTVTTLQNFRSNLRAVGQLHDQMWYKEKEVWACKKYTTY